MNFVSLPNFYLLSENKFKDLKKISVN